MGWGSGCRLVRDVSDVFDLFGPHVSDLFEPVVPQGKLFG